MCHINDYSMTLMKSTLHLSDHLMIRGNISNWHMDKSPKMMWHGNSRHDRHAYATWPTNTYLHLKNDYAFSDVALFVWNGLATCAYEIMTCDTNSHFKILIIVFTWVMWHTTFFHVILTRGMTRMPSGMPSEQVATMSEPHGKGSSQLSFLDEVDVVSMSCPQQLYVHYNLSIITKRYIVIMVLYDMF